MTNRNARPVPPPDVVLDARSWLAVAQTLHFVGQSIAALERTERALLLTTQPCHAEVRYQALLHRAWIYAECGRRDEGRNALGLAFALGRERGYAQKHFYLNNEHVLARLCAWALQLGIEVEYSRAVIRERRLLPRFAGPTPDGWP